MASLPTVRMVSRKKGRNGKRASIVVNAHEEHDFQYSDRYRRVGGIRERQGESYSIRTSGGQA